MTLKTFFSEFKIEANFKQWSFIFEKGSCAKTNAIEGALTCSDKVNSKIKEEQFAFHIKGQLYKMSLKGIGLFVNFVK